jgi:dipeptidyl aminopeptidase/acylaminoacyl peptidase
MVAEWRCDLLPVRPLGSSQVWRLPLTGGEASKVTDLPLDVDNFRLSPQGDRLLFSMAVYRDCADLACSKRLDEQAKVKASGKVYDKLFVRHWDTWADGRNNVLYSAPIDASGKVSAQPVSLSGKLDGDVPSKPFGDHDEYFSPDGKTVAFSARIAGKTEAWSTNFDVYTVPATGGEPKNLTADNRPGTPRPSIRRTARPWPTWPWTSRPSKRTASTWC